MRLTESEAIDRFLAARVLRLATADTHGHPHLIPATFAESGGKLVIAVDHKPKRHQRLKRLRNIAENSSVCALVDVYDDDWNRLWWVRVDGEAAMLEDAAARAEAADQLAAKYPQYRATRPDGPIIAISVHRWSGWSYTET
ncbi:TIGR03668 family PPOX class F420-dependent oxidoreductase [Streptomyces gobiensis]|uniref:TIGR03668 family PPOX class F420-dependent oxidoreductase n=1 Tax=Streptomyces gobiensis TaxID=2875706 RepID=UPI001E3F9CB7|nr:TIGR03668 family PPOX class F420-dependent oxidoreductase [Streptomyces gobiensis]UGY91553.1 TIGR03668 family PPOX class F420-dependent oxidoreductase [Streptomyces gobiensis]